MKIVKFNNSSGFTLIELVVVLFIVGLIAGMTVPRVSNMTGVKLRGTARRLSAQIGYVYETAILKKTNFRICFDVMEQVWWTEERSGDEYVKTSDVLLTPELLPEGVFFRRVVVMDREATKEEPVCAYFTPYGYVEEAVVQIENENGTTGFTVFTDPMSGKAIIYEGFADE